MSDVRLRWHAPAAQLLGARAACQLQHTVVLGAGSLIGAECADAGDGLHLRICRAAVAGRENCAWPTCCLAPARWPREAARLAVSCFWWDRMILDTLREREGTEMQQCICVLQVAAPLSAVMGRQNCCLVMKKACCGWGAGTGRSRALQRS